MDKKLLEILACPKCKGSLSLYEDTLLCPQCSLLYPIKNNTPIMLLEEAVPVNKTREKNS